MLSKYVKKKKNWDDFIDTCIFAYNTSHHESTSFTPFNLMFGRKAYLPVDINISKSSPEEHLKKWKKANSSLSCAAATGVTDC